MSPITRILLASLLVFLAFSGCSLQTEEVASETSADESLTLAYTRHDEDIAVANLTAVVMEKYAGYDVTLTGTTPRDAMRGVSSGDYDAYQGAWSPVQDRLFSKDESDGDFDQLKDWLFGKTRAGLAAPAYLRMTSMDEVEKAGIKRAFVLEPEAFALGGVPEAVFEKYGLTPTYYPDMAALWEEAGPLYEREEPFVVFAYSPNWTNLEYELNYLEGEKLLYKFNAPHAIRSVARPGLGIEDPLAYAMLDGLKLTEPQLENLELSIQDAQDPRKGAEDWAAENESLMESWVYEARQRTS